MQIFILIPLYYSVKFTATRGFPAGKNHLNRKKKKGNPSGMKRLLIRQLITQTLEFKTVLGEVFVFSAYSPNAF
ncbi:MAG TPA: hypothetical protein PK453_04275 [Leptospiraceae bacterium]|nr:hypothetical protein [Leptospiraceae bacterium]HNF12862.1 hypothetical protein [Leptospiraceae bacterium]